MGKSLIGLALAFSLATGWTETYARPSLSQELEAITCARNDIAEFSGGNEAVMRVFDNLLAEWRDYSITSHGRFNLLRLLEAAALAARFHEGQYRKDSAHTPYIVHPLIVCRNAWTEGQIRSINVLVAALLHDTLEDTNVTPEELSQRFGERVLATVEELSNDPSLTTEQNKQRQIDHAPSMSLDAQIVKLADRLANIRDLAAEPPVQWTQDKVDGYFAWAEKLLYALHGSNPGLEWALEQELKKHSDNR